MATGLGIYTNDLQLTAEKSTQCAQFAKSAHIND